MLRKFALAACSAAVLALTGCASSPIMSTAEEVAEIDAKYHRFEFDEKKSYANNLLNTMHPFVKLKDSEVPQEDFNVIGMAGTAYSIGGLAAGTGSGFGLGLGLLMDLFTPTPEEPWKQSATMIILPTAQNPDKLASLEAVGEKLAQASAETTKEMGYDSVRVVTHVTDNFNAPKARTMFTENLIRFPAEEAGKYHWWDLVWFFNKKQFARPAEKVPAWIDPKQPEAWVHTMINTDRSFGYGGEELKSVNWTSPELPEAQREKLCAEYYQKLQKRLPEGVYIYVPPFKVDKKKMTPPFVMTKNKVWYFVVPEKK